MSSKTVRNNFRVEVEPRDPGDFGAARIGGRTQPEEDWERACEEIARDIRRHVDGLPTFGRRGVSVQWDSEKVCDHCGYRWGGEDEEYNGGCCEADQKAEDQRHKIAEEDAREEAFNNGQFGVGA